MLTPKPMDQNLGSGSRHVPPWRIVDPVLTASHLYQALLAIHLTSASLKPSPTPCRPSTLAIWCPSLRTSQYQRDLAVHYLTGPCLRAHVHLNTQQLQKATRFQTLQTAVVMLYKSDCIQHLKMRMTGELNRLLKESFQTSCMFWNQPEIKAS